MKKLINTGLFVVVALVGYLPCLIVGAAIDSIIFTKEFIDIVKSGVNEFMNGELEEA